LAGPTSLLGGLNKMGRRDLFRILSVALELVVLICIFDGVAVMRLILTSGGAD
jgi:hypothetical protein